MFPKKTGTLFGQCLRIDPNHYENFSPQHTLMLTAAYEEGDSFSTIGWTQKSGLSAFTATLGTRDVLLPAHRPDLTSYYFDLREMVHKLYV